jgi:hypothetical protein
MITTTTATSPTLSGKVKLFLSSHPNLFNFTLLVPTCLVCSHYSTEFLVRDVRSQFVPSKSSFMLFHEMEARDFNNLSPDEQQAALRTISSFIRDIEQPAGRENEQWELRGEVESTYFDFHPVSELNY